MLFDGRIILCLQELMLIAVVVNLLLMDFGSLPNSLFCRKYFSLQEFFLLLEVLYMELSGCGGPRVYLLGDGVVSL